MDDASIMRTMRELVREEDWLLEAVTQSGYASFCWRTVDYELAELLEDVEAPLMRAESAGQHFVFEANGLVVDVAVVSRSGQTLIQGWVEPIAAMTIRVHTSDGRELASGPVDEHGRFQLPVTHRGAVRLELCRESSIRTDWFSV